MTETVMLFCNNYEANYDAWYNMMLDNKKIEELYSSGRDFHYVINQLILFFEMSIDEILKSSEFMDFEKLELISFAKEYWKKIQDNGVVSF
ncbi:hypothetical protein JCM17380_16530 [Desulfosporosinus burensis]